MTNPISLVNRNAGGLASFHPNFHLPFDWDKLINHNWSPIVGAIHFHTIIIHATMLFVIVTRAIGANVGFDPLHFHTTYCFDVPCGLNQQLANLPYHVSMVSLGGINLRKRTQQQKIVKGVPNELSLADYDTVRFANVPQDSGRLCAPKLMIMARGRGGPFLTLPYAMPRSPPSEQQRASASFTLADD